MLPVPTVADLAEFTGRDEDDFGDFAAQALTQATLLLSLVTMRTELPDDADLAQLAVNAILEMADRLYLEQPYAATKAAPYTSEHIGSYSYSKGSLFAQAREKKDTGLLWWELALDELSLSDRSLVDYGSISALEREIYSDGEDRWVLSPADTEASAVQIGFYNAELPRSTLG